jgi:neutral ceramidase
MTSNLKFSIHLLTGMLLASTLHAQTPSARASIYHIGVGISDITGEAAGVGMMGYASLMEKTAGIHQRLRARAFIVQDPGTKKSIVIVITDTGLVTQAVHQAVLKRLAARFGSIYNEQNLILSATHTHAGPGGYSHYTLYNISILGFQKRTFDAMVDGIVEAIDKAHQHRAPGDILFNQGELTQASVNRSATAFRLNAAADRAAFPLEIDPLMSVLTFRQQGKSKGALSLFPTHATSMTNTNTLISGDNKGYAAYHWEHAHAGVRYDTDKAPFVAAFAQTNAGDMSPNLNLKPGSGPTEDQFENTRLIGLRQANKAIALSQQSGTPLTGGLDYRMRYVDMSRVSISGAYTPDGKPHTTCAAALGASFAAGSEEDGPGPGIANEGESNPFIAGVGRLVFTPSEDINACHGVKEVVIPVGDMHPHPWAPEVLPIQLVRLGQVYLATLPAEATIMSGYRIRRQLAHTLGTDINQVLVVGYTNAYAHYITTPEEYNLQSYEGGSTLFGPYTQPAYQQELDKLAMDMVNEHPTTNTSVPRDLSCCQSNFQPGVWFDMPSISNDFGSVVKDAQQAYRRGQLVETHFQTGHPKNNLRRNGSFLYVQQLVRGTWTNVANDADWSTTYRWTRTFGAASVAEISWKIPTDASLGTYRIVHHGEAKPWNGTIRSFTGISRIFEVKPN